MTFFGRVGEAPPEEGHVERGLRDLLLGWPRMGEHTEGEDPRVPEHDPAAPGPADEGLEHRAEHGKESDREGGSHREESGVMHGGLLEALLCAPYDRCIRPKEGQGVRPDAGLPADARPRAGAGGLRARRVPGEPAGSRAAGPAWRTR